MAKRRGAGDGPDLADVLDVLGGLAHDAGRLAQQQWELLRAEVRQELRQLEYGVGAMGAGAVLAAAGGVLSTLALVHALHRATRLPLWACYGLLGGTATAAGVGLLAQGRRQVAALRLAPETTEALAENFEWIGHQLGRETGPTDGPPPE